MKIEEIKTKLPKKEEKIEIFYQNCEKRKKFISGDKENHKFHLKKSRHDLFRAIKEFEDKCWDWTVIKAYYALHHAANGLLLKKQGFFCKDHSCLIIALKFYKLINEEQFKELSKLHESFSDIFGFDLTFQLRKIGQYDVYEWENVKNSGLKSGACSEFLNTSKIIFNFSQSQVWSLRKNNFLSIKEEDAKLIIEVAKKFLSYVENASNN
ncbi:HEPN domain-containing protein [Candidatus Pacearchaeota archaeon]|nr:HEPN domain-containing protein [Candidatus Pacearchaeota archaeon]